MTKHKWHKEIKAWADGAEIECQSKADPDKEWQEFDGNWGEIEGWKFRIKSQPKEPQDLTSKSYLYVYNINGEIKFCEPNSIIEVPSGKLTIRKLGKIKLEADDDTSRT